MTIDETIQMVQRLLDMPPKPELMLLVAQTRLEEIRELVAQAGWSDQVAVHASPFVAEDEAYVLNGVMA